MTEFGRKREEFRSAKTRLFEPNSFELERNGVEKLVRTDRIEAKNLTVRYDSTPIFSGLNLVLEKGLFCVVRGENGSGKTTLLNALLGVLEAKTGEILYSGIPLSRIDRYAARKSLFTITNQEPYLCNGTFRDNIAYGAERPLDPDKTELIVRGFLSSFKNRGLVLDTLIQGETPNFPAGKSRKFRSAGH